MGNRVARMDVTVEATKETVSEVMRTEKPWKAEQMFQLAMDKILETKKASVARGWKHQRKCIEVCREARKEKRSWIDWQCQ